MPHSSEIFAPPQVSKNPNNFLLSILKISRTKPWNHSLNRSPSSTSSSCSLTSTQQHSIKVHPLCILISSFFYDSLISFFLLTWIHQKHHFLSIQIRDSDVSSTFESNRYGQSAFLQMDLMNRISELYFVFLKMYVTLPTQTKLLSHTNPHYIY